VRRCDQRPDSVCCCALGHAWRCCRVTHINSVSHLLVFTFHDQLSYILGIEKPKASCPITHCSTTMHFKQLSVLALVGHAFAQQTPTLAQALNSTAELSQLASVLGLVPGVVSALSSAQNITILAPSNSAFGKVPNATLSTLTANPGMLTALLQYHVLQGAVPASAITNTSTFVPTLLTNETYANVSDVPCLGNLCLSADTA